MGEGEKIAFEIITSHEVLLLLKTIPSAPCSIGSQGKHSSHAQSRVDRPRHLSLSSLLEVSFKMAWFVSNLGYVKRPGWVLLFNYQKRTVDPWHLGVSHNSTLWKLTLKLWRQRVAFYS